MNEAAERYSPEIAEAFQPTETDRPATKKSLAVFDCFADADETYRNAMSACNRRDHPAFCGAVELGQHQPRDAERIVERFHLVERILAGVRIEHEQDFMRRAGNGFRDHALYLGDFFHQVKLSGQASRGVAHDDVGAARFCRIDGVENHRGRIARLLNGTSRFGAEFDSLSDFLCFGVAPSFVLYLWSLRPWGAYGYMPCLLFAVCVSLRLARFNAALDSAPKPAYAYNFFTGVPAPACAGLVLFPLFAGLEAKTVSLEPMMAIVSHPLFCAAFLVGTGALAVSTLPIWSFKNFRVQSKFVLPLLLGVALYFALLIADPWVALAAGGAIYLGMIPLSVRSFRRLRREAELAHTD